MEIVLTTEERSLVVKTLQGGKRCEFVTPQAQQGIEVSKALIHSLLCERRTAHHHFPQLCLKRMQHPPLHLGRNLVPLGGVRCLTLSLFFGSDP